MKTVVTVVGARPQFIKAAPLSKALAAAGGIVEHIVHTGQHFDANMSDVFFNELGIESPARYLGISGGTHGAMTGAMLAALEASYLELKPDMVLVYGDTNSTLAGTLAASKLHIPVAHVEAGLRSYNRRMPEEQNRIVTDHLADLLLTPSNVASSNLAREGIPSARVVQVGDIMYDAALQVSEVARCSSTILDQLGIQERGYVLSTVHRAENTDEPERLLAIVEALEMVAREIPVVLPLHPRTRAILEKLGRKLDGVQLIEPVGYLDMVLLEAAAAVVATDSGGVQKEAYFHGVPCITLRDETEWVELVESGWNRLEAPTDSGRVAAAILNAQGRTGQAVTPYGDGKAAEKIVKAIDRLLGSEV
jgi:UDP-GlcNAc3NAcA epimerase